MHEGLVVYGTSLAFLRNGGVLIWRRFAIMIYGSILIMAFVIDPDFNLDELRSVNAVNSM